MQSAINQVLGNIGDKIHAYSCQYLVVNKVNAIICNQTINQVMDRVTKESYANMIVNRISQEIRKQSNIN